jgi:D-beta-D-heptose 7-phosphate kinase/D-beta-D-heptose 1-phosphate adenosyltransferase
MLVELVLIGRLISASSRACWNGWNLFVSRWNVITAPLRESLVTAKIMTWDECARWIRGRQDRGERVVFANGCFDLVHAGHVHLLQEARSFGDHLVVGINSDDSVRRLKGDSRPVMPLEDRLAVLAAFSMVDALVVFPQEEEPDEAASDHLWDTPHSLLEQLRPDVLVKGGDYQEQEVIGREFVPEVRIVPLLKGRSSSELLKRAELIFHSKAELD